MTLRPEAGTVGPRWTTKRGTSSKILYDLRQGEMAPIRCAVPGDLVVIDWNGFEGWRARNPNAPPMLPYATAALVAWHQGKEVFVRVRNPRMEMPDVLDDLAAIHCETWVRFLGLRVS